MIETALLAVTGEAVALVSLTLDYGASLQPGDAVTLEASIERATRTLIFAHGRVLRADGALALTGSAVLRRLEVSGAA
ncbi:MAG: hotdog domain-containing protein [Phenylobacterium sp.]|uniref:hotdog domain-containing protein n=1 Tax=Phenylobacterium sp. TaxID=1871053 RepID=UPI0027271581|nr:hotdog domain-containing protein [Phenylobacterium sp.]MDO8902289.1 hotdog domain-containing protein [Phenylobacterium sp.]MDP2213906.1 hotdog domain-containing protein [Phenylobacterium sp.]